MDTRTPAAIGPDALNVLAALQDPVRARLYAFVRAQPTAVTREEAAAAAGVSRKLAAFHLDKLVAAGLLEADRGARPGRRGPGRAPKAYAPAPGEWQLTVPDRRYDMLARMLVRALATEQPDESGRAAAIRVAGESGRELGAAVRAQRGLGRLGVERATSATRELLASAGYEPRLNPATPGVIDLGNCPFAQLAAASPELVCALNERFLQGVLEGLGAAERLHGVLCPGRAGCCVQIRAVSADSADQAPTA